MKLNFQLTAFLFLGLFTSTAAHAQFRSGTEGGNGGDLCEARFYEVRNDISNWIDNGGADAIKLPKNLTLPNYKNSMKSFMQKAQVSCVTETLKIGTSEKTCINKFVNNEPVIACNATRFMQAAQEDQYQLVHHEYAGLAGYEVNQTEASDYTISSQLSGYLEKKIVTKLAIKPSGETTYLMRCNNAYSGGLSIQIANGYYYFIVHAQGYTPTLSFAEKLGLEKDQYTKALIKFPANQCSSDYSTGRVHCNSTQKSSIEFTDISGNTKKLSTIHISLLSGVIGVGNYSKQATNLVVGVGSKGISETFTYGANLHGEVNKSARWILCGRPTN